MAIKKVQANFDVDGNGTYDVLHYETQLKQVKKVDANGNVTGDLEAELARVDSDIDTVDAKVDNANVDITNLENKVSVNTTLNTTAKTVIPAINELKGRADTNASDIDALEARVTDAESDILGHTHDNLYLKLIGGNLTGHVSMANTKAFKGKNTSGVDLNLAYIDGSNQSRFGDITAKAIINALDADLKVYDGTTSYEVFHSGNMGANSGLDADKLDGLQGSSYARVDATPVFKQGVQVAEGDNLVFKAISGGSDAGDLIWQKGDGTQLGRQTVDANGNMLFYTGGALTYHSIRATGELQSVHNHIHNATDREVRIVFKSSDTDAGMGLYMNNSSKQMGIYDWDNAKFLMTTDRTSGVLQFTNGVEIQGHKVSIQSSAPANPTTGDIWFDI